MVTQGGGRGASFVRLSCGTAQRQRSSEKDKLVIFVSVSVTLTFYLVIEVSWSIWSRGCGWEAGYRSWREVRAAQFDDTFLVLV